MKRVVDQSTLARRARSPSLRKMSSAQLIELVEAQQRELEAARVIIRMLREPPADEPFRVIYTNR